MPKRMIEKLFVDHPRSVDESYVEHMGVATAFGGRLLLASLACFVHALIPGLCVRTGSEAIRTLHDRMVTNRRRRAGTSDSQINVYGLSGDAI